MTRGPPEKRFSQPADRGWAGIRKGVQALEAWGRCPEENKALKYISCFLYRHIYHKPKFVKLEFFFPHQLSVFTAHWGTTPSIGSIHFLGTCPNLPGMDSTGFYSVAGPLVAITRRRTFWIPWNRMGNSGLQVW